MSTDTSACETMGEGPLVPNLLNSFEFSNGYGEADSWFESRLLRHELSFWYQQSVFEFSMSANSYAGSGALREARRRRFLRRDESTRHLRRSTRDSLVRAMWWYGSLSPSSRLRAGRVRCKMRDRVRRRPAMLRAIANEPMQTRGDVAACSNQAGAVCRPSDGGPSVQADGATQPRQHRSVQPGKPVLSG